MSAKAMGRVWELKLPHAEMLVLLAMADHADHEGNNIHPSVGLIAWKTGYSERQVQRSIKQLRKRKLLVQVKAPRGRAIIYRIDFTNAALKDPYLATGSDEADDPRQNVTGDNMTPDKMSGGG